MKRLFRSVAVFVAIVALIAIGLSIRNDRHSNVPKPQAQGVKAPASLHWKDTAVPPNLDMLRRAVEEIGYGLSEAGYTPVSENVDNGNAPKVLVTHWLSPKGDALIELDSARGVTGISLKRADYPQYKALGPLWYRCSIDNGRQINGLDQLAQLNKLNTAALREKCRIVTYGE